MFLSGTHSFSFYFYDVIRKFSLRFSCFGINQIKNSYITQRSEKNTVFLFFCKLIFNWPFFKFCKTVFNLETNCESHIKSNQIKTKSFLPPTNTIHNLFYFHIKSWLNEYYRAHYVSDSSRCGLSICILFFGDRFSHVA